MAGSARGLLSREFWRSDEPTILEVRGGLVRVCLDEVLILEVPRSVAVVVAMLSRLWAGTVGEEGEELESLDLRSSKVAECCLTGYLEFSSIEHRSTAIYVCSRRWECVGLWWRA